MRREFMTGETDRYYVERCLDLHRDDFRHLVLRYQKPLLAGIRCYSPYGQPYRLE